MRKWTAPTLLSLTIMGILIRLWPLTKFEIWGSDTGEYYSLTERLVSDGHLSTAYNGWGLGYPYFPGAEVLVGAFQSMTGLDLFWTLILLLPMVGALTTPMVFLLGKWVFDDVRAGLMASAIVAVAMPHVFATSHPMPGALGDPMAVLCILLYLISHERRRAMIPGILAVVALIPTHHLSTFFVLVPILFCTFVREFIRSRGHEGWIPVDMVYLVMLLGGSLFYWLGVAIPFREEVMTEAFGVHPFLIALIALALIAGAVLLVRFRRRWLHFRYKPSFHDLGREIIKFVIMNAILISSLVIVGLFKVPGTEITVGLGDILLLFPISVLGSFSILGVGGAEFSRRGFFVLSWSAALVICLLVGIVTENTVLLPYRQLQYLMIPVALLAGWGISTLADLTIGLDAFRSRGKGLALTGGLAVLVFSAGLTSYPSRDLLGGFEEGITTEEMDGVRWTESMIPARGTMVASDHRISSMLFGFAELNATWDYAYFTMHGDLDDARAELRSVDAPAGKEKIDYVLLSGPMKEGVALLQWENARPMSGESLEKFEDRPFEKIYESNNVEIFFVGEV